MEILHTFGIDWVLLVAQIINFAIILFVLKKFLYKPIMTMLAARREEIKKGIEDAEKARVLLEEATQREQKLLKNAQSEAKKTIDEAKKQADILLAKAKDDTKKEAEKILKDAKEQITFETKQAEKRLVTHISDLAISMIAKAIPDVVTDEERTSIIKETTKKLKGKVN